jgi:hypothetical protein
MTPRKTMATPETTERPVAWAGLWWLWLEAGGGRGLSGYGEAYAHEAEAGANPGEEGSLAAK